MKNVLLAGLMVCSLMMTAVCRADDAASGLQSNSQMEKRVADRIQTIKSEAGCKYVGVGYPDTDTYYYDSHFNTQIYDMNKAREEGQKFAWEDYLRAIKIHVAKAGSEYNIEYLLSDDGKLYVCLLYPIKYSGKKAVKTSQK